MPELGLNRVQDRQQRALQRQMRGRDLVGPVRGRHGVACGGGHGVLAAVARRIMAEASSADQWVCSVKR
jgi:hypothetical protein